MIKRLLTLPFLLFAFLCYSQELTGVTFSGATTFSYFSYTTDQGVIIRISDDGKIIEWGTPAEALRYNVYTPKLQPFLGRIDYYGAEADTIVRGKVKSIGTVLITYYDSYEKSTKAGKLKALGRVRFDYYSDFENAALKGRIQTAGSSLFTYYASYENEAFRGKLKSVGSTAITYYSSFDIDIIRGKLKAIGPSNFIWYTSNDQYRGGLKQGYPRQIISGVNYIIM